MSSQNLQSGAFRMMKAENFHIREGEAAVQILLLFHLQVKQVFQQANVFLITFLLYDHSYRQQPHR